MTAAPRTPPEFVEWLVSRHPDLAPILDQHLGDNDELLAHLLLGDVTRHAADLARRATWEPETDAALVRLLEDLDSAIFNDPVRNLVWVSFVENASTDADEPLRSRLSGSRTLASP